VANADGKQRTARMIDQTGDEHNNNRNEDNVQHMEDIGFTIMIRLRGVRHSARGCEPCMYATAVAGRCIGNVIP
jgi:hypothetical protein